MHRYTVEADSRVKIIGIIGVVSFVTMSIVYSVIIPEIKSTIPDSYQFFPLMFSLIGFGSIFAIFYKIFNESVWKIAPSIITATPDLSGNWEGHVSENEKINFDDYINNREDYIESENKLISSELEVYQDWTQIEFNYERDLPNEDSKSIVAGIRDIGGSGPDIWYIFRNSGNTETGEYYGVAKFNLDQSSSNRDVLKGRFFTGSYGGFDGEAIFIRS